MNLSPPSEVATYPPLAELIPPHWQQGYVTAADGATLHYTRTGGQKPALLLLHGVQGAGLMWLRTAAALQDEYDVVMPDFRGHGQSSRIGDSVSTELLVDDTASLIAGLGLGRPAVAGHSMGADVAGRLAADHPLRALVLVDPALANFAAAMAFDPDNPPPWMATLFATMRSLSSLPHSERMVAAGRLLPPGTPAWAAADYVAFAEAMAQFDLAMYRHTGGMAYLFESPEVLARIACPTLLLTARSMRPDIDTAPGRTALQRQIPDCQHIHFPDSGHFINYDQFERFVTALRAFLHEHQ